MKKFLGCFFVTFLLLSVLSGRGFADAKNLTLKFAIPTTIDDFAGKGVLLMKEVVEKESKGGVKLNIFPGGQLGSMREHWEGCQAGVIDMVTVISSSLEPFVPEVAVLGMPFLFPNDYENSFEKMWDIMDNTVQPLLNNHMKKK
ncbi:MAG: TRAP transporter substrate-binding protein DctP, partial [Caldisericia bacterium]|nr:TRAP transporter substrate-binding protein DctP [Caldisericia bacterium]